MSTVAEGCSCQWQVTDEIRLCPTCHRYFKGTQEFTSVSKVIKHLLPTDYSGVDPVTLECARLRGVFVDTYFSEWLADPGSTFQLASVKSMIAPMFPRDHEKHAEDTITRIERLLDWWTAQNYKAVAVQKTVYSEGDGVAGTFDLATEDLILDLKCVSALQPNYKLQLGAYRTYSEREYQRVGIVHVTKDKVKLVAYDAKLCGLYWKKCVAWWQTQKDLI